jgi:hypothetical protein
MIIERARKKRSARITNIKEGDTNKKNIHLRVNARRRKNQIQRLKHNGGWVTEHKRKEKFVHEHFASVTRRGVPRTKDLNWESLQLGNVAMDGIDAPFLEEEV